MSILTTLLNPIEWVRAYRFHQQNAKFDKSSYDLELYLYSKILTNDMLHYGYFEDINVKPESISLQLLEEAQIRYAQNIVEQIRDDKNLVLDVGCGMGGLAKMMLDKELNVEVLTPNKNQIEHISHKYPQLKRYHCKFEHIVTDSRYGTIINSESLQYIALDDAFAHVEKLLLPDGRWIIVDYFRINETGINKSGHLLTTFYQKCQLNGWEIVFEQDITKNVVPTIAFVNMYAERFLQPLKHFAFEKLRFKKAWLFYLVKGLRKNIDEKIQKEKASIDPVMFLSEKKYVLFVLTRKNR